MKDTITYKGLQFTIAKAETGGVCLNVFDKTTNEYIFNSGILRNKEELLKRIKNTKNYYNDILNQCLARVK